MSKHKVELRCSSDMSDEERRRRLAAAYRLILSWPDAEAEQETQDQQPENAQEVEEARSDETSIEQ